MPITYTVDYTGTALPNKILNEPHSISAANFRNYKVIIPEFTPFHVNGLVITHPATNYTLIEDQDYFLTHLYVEASQSIGHDIYGSISIISNLTGVFEVDYQTIGGNWTLPANVIANILANLAINPRVAYWTQVSLYPAVFPSINHSTDVEDLIGMTEVVQSIDALSTAVENNQNLGGISDPYASIAEGKSGMLVDRVMNPATTYAAIQESIAVFRTEINGSSDDSSITLFNKDFFGNASFINNAYKVVYENAVFATLKGLAYIDGLRNEALLDIPLSINSYPKDVWLESFFNASSNDVEHLITTADAELVTNVLPYSSDLNASMWTGLQDGVSSTGVILPNSAYNVNNIRSLARIIMTDSNTVARLRFYTTRMTVGATYTVSFYARTISGNTNLTIKLGLGGHSGIVVLTPILTRFVIGLVYTDHDQLSFRLAAAGVFELGDIQAEASPAVVVIPSPDNLSLNNWTKTGASIAINSTSGPWPISSSINKLTETAVNGEHSVSGTFACIDGHSYKVSFIAKQSERDTIEIVSTGDGTANGTSRLVVSTGTLLTTSAAHTAMSVTAITEDATVTGYKLVSFIIYAKANDTSTLSIKLYNGSNSYNGISGNGVYIASLVIADTRENITVRNLSTGSDVLDYPIWTKSNAFIDKRRFVDYLGSETAFKLVESVTNNGHSLVTENSVLADRDIVFSFYAKAAERSKIKVTLSGGTGGVSYTVNLLDVNSYNTASIGTGWTLPAGNISSVGNGWSRISVKGHGDSSATAYPITCTISILDESGTVSYIGDGISGVLIDRPQLEHGTIPTAYIAAPHRRANDLVISYLNVATSYKAAATKTSWYDHNGNYHRYIKLATILSSSIIKDWRNVTYVSNTLVDKSAKIYKPITVGMEIVPDNYYWLENNQTVLLPSTQFLSKGASFYFEKSLGSICTLGLEDTGQDLIFANNYDTGQLVSDTEFTYNSSSELKVIFNGSDYEIRY